MLKKHAVIKQVFLFGTTPVCLIVSISVDRLFSWSSLALAKGCNRLAYKLFETLAMRKVIQHYWL